MSEAVGELREIDSRLGCSRYRDPVTEGMGLLASAWDSLHKTYQANLLRSQHGSPYLEPILAGAAEETKRARDRVGSKLMLLMKRHPVWPWLAEHPGVRGVHTARLISCIGDPLRFPGCACEKSHYLPEDHGATACPVLVYGEEKGSSDLCGAPIGSRRRGTGVRALWHFCGVHVDSDGRSPRKRKGVKCTWNPMARTCLLQPDGIADQIVRQRCEPWRTVYDKKKSKVKKERGADSVSAIDNVLGFVSDSGEGGLQEQVESGDTHGPSPADASEEGVMVDCPYEREEVHGLRPFQVDAIARKVAVKAFLGDLLMEWKKRA